MIIKYNKDDNILFNCHYIDINQIKEDLDKNPFGKYFLYIENNEVIGFLYYSEIYERIEINQIEIKKELRNSGKGSKLLNELISNVNKDITLEVKIDNFPAISLYKKFNFKKVAIRKGYYNGIDGILMERKKDSL